LEYTHWFGQHLADIIPNAGIIGGFLITAYTIHRDGNARRVGNLIAINGQYQEIQEQLIRHPELKRIFDVDADVGREPISIEEESFVNMHIGQLSTVYRARKQGEFVNLEGLHLDIQGFFSLPIPKAVWEKFRPFQDKGFVLLVENSLRPKIDEHQ